MTISGSNAGRERASRCGTTTSACSRGSREQSHPTASRGQPRARPARRAWPASAAGCRIPARAGGRCWPRWTPACPPRSSPPRCTSASSPATTAVHREGPVRAAVGVRRARGEGGLIMPDNRHALPHAAGQSRHRAVRRHRRPGQTQAAARAVPPGHGRPDAARLPHRRLGAASAHDRRAVPRARQAACADSASPSPTTPPGRLRRSLSFGSRRTGQHRRWRAAVQRAEKEIGGSPRRLFHLAIPPAAFDVDGAACSAPPAWPATDPGHHREAVRHRPGLGAGAQPDRARGLRRVADLPDRPLPRQGVGRQHPGVPVRQRPVRAGLEPRAHPLRADRRARDAVDRGAGRLLRRDRRLPRHDRDPPVPGAGRSSPWSRRRR